jgi:hypothetical protein
MHHSWWKFTACPYWTFDDSSQNKKLYPMVNKIDAEVSIVCLSCHFDVGLFPYHRPRGTPLAFSVIHVCLQWQELAWDLSRVTWGLGIRISRGTRFSTYGLTSICFIIVLALTLAIQDAYDGGNESSKLVSIIIFGRFIKSCNHYLPLRRAFLLLLCWVFTFYLYAPSKRA